MPHVLLLEGCTGAGDENKGHALAASTCAARLSVLRTFFCDLQEWEMIPRRFDPICSLVTPKNVLAKIGPNPRIISDDVWAKLVWAGLNLTADDLPKHRYGGKHRYPVELGSDDRFCVTPASQSQFRLIPGAWTSNEFVTALVDRC